MILILPHRKLIVLADPISLLAVSCALYIIYEISSTRAMNGHKLERQYHQYMPIGYYDRWGAANQAMGLVGLLSFGFAYVIIGASHHIADSSTKYSLTTNQFQK